MAGRFIKAILDQGLFEFRRQLDYKLTWNGGHLVSSLCSPEHQPDVFVLWGMPRRIIARHECLACVEGDSEESADLFGALNDQCAKGRPQRNGGGATLAQIETSHTILLFSCNLRILNKAAEQIAL